MKKHMKVVMLLAVSFYFMVASPPTINAAACLSVVPGSGMQGDQGLEVTIVGDSTNFMQGITEVNFANPGITVTSVTVDSPAQVRVTVDIAEDAPVGLGDVTATTVAEVIICSNAFEVLEKIETDVTLTVGNGSGFPGSHNNSVMVSLDNSNDKIKGVSLDICRGDDLTLSTCESTVRTAGINCNFDDQGNGCNRIVFMDIFGNDFIESGTGPILTLKYDVSPGAPFESCQNLTPESVLIISCIDDGAGGCTPGPPLTNVTLEDGEFCFLNCQVNGDCNDGSFCNGVETCLDGVCQPGTDPCPGQMCNETNDECVDCLTDLDCDDGSFCNGLETCDSESGNCQPGDGDPCLPGASCNEEEDVCNCSLDGDCIDDVFCNGVETCLDGVCQPGTDPCPGQMCNETTEQCVIPAVTLDIGNGSGFRGTTNNPVTVNLDNPDDRIKGLQFDLCRGPYLTLTGCSSTARSEGLNCNFEDQGNGCNRIVLLDFSSGFIETGTGPIITLEYDVSSGAPFESCQNLTPESVLIVSCIDDGAGGCTPGPPFTNVTLEDGEFCIATPIPTLSEWGLIIFLTIVMGIGVMALLRKRTIV